MRIAVCIKQVPVVAALSFDPESKTLRRSGVPTEVSSFDVRALLWAVASCQDLGGVVTVVTMGPPLARDALGHCLALGADCGLHLSDPAFAGADTLATARALAAALQPRRFDLILCGRSSVDAETGQVGPELAELLDISQVTCVRALHVDPERRIIRAEREVDDGIETIEADLPCVVSAAEDLAPERFPSKAEKQAAQTKPITVVTASDLAADHSRFGRAGSPTWVLALQSFPTTRLGKLIEAETPSKTAEILANTLVREHGLFSQWRLPEPATLEYETGSPATAGRRGQVWVLAEEVGGEPRSVSLELLGKGRRLANAFGTEMSALVFSPHAAACTKALAAHGADHILINEQLSSSGADVEGVTAALAAAIRAADPEILLAPASTFGRDVMSRVAARLGLGLTGDCVDLGLDADGRLLQLKPAFGGTVVAPILSRTRPQMATIRPGMLPRGTTDASRPLSVSVIPTETRSARARQIAKRVDPLAATDLDDAEIVIGIGKGLGEWRSFERVQGLVELLGAAICITRDVSDAGWLPKQRQVGMTGRAIAPKLYIAIGVRGAFEHIVGVRRAGLIVAINKSPKAPIFKNADYGLVGGYEEIVPPLERALAELRANSVK